MRQCRYELLREFRGHDKVLGRYGTDAVRERRASQICIEQGNDTADAGDAKPYCDVLGPVAHQQADNFTFANALIKRPSGVLIDPLERAAGRSCTRVRRAGPARYPIARPAPRLRSIGRDRDCARWVQSVRARATRPWTGPDGETMVCSGAMV